MDLSGLFKRKPKAAFSFADIKPGCDFHCHLLAGVDDGVQTIEESVDILNAMSKAGYGKAVLTPHMNPEIFPMNTETYIQARFEDFISQTSGKHTVELSLGGEYMVTEDFCSRISESMLQIEPGKVLIEMSYLYPSPNIEKAIFELMMAGLTPVLAHPERYTYYSNDPDQLQRLHDMGALFQVNLLSLTGAYGPGSMSILKYISDNGLRTYFGSDTHSISHFQRILSEPYFMIP